MTLDGRENPSGLKLGMATWGFLLMALALVGLGIARYGSLHAALAVTRGQTILVDAEIKSFGVAIEGEEVSIPFVLKNLSSKPIRILGSQMYCSCTTSDMLPIRIEGGTTHRFRIFVRPSFLSLNPPSNHFRQDVRLFTTVPEQSQLVLTIVGEVRTKLASRTASCTFRDFMRSSVRIAGRGDSGCSTPGGN